MEGLSSDTDLIIEIGDETTEGQLVLDDVEFRKERDNEVHHGIGNDDPSGIRYGKPTYHVTATAILNGAAAELATSLDANTTLSGELIDENSGLEIDVGKLDWNDVRIEANDDGDVMMNAEFDARQYEEITQ